MAPIRPRKNIVKADKKDVEILHVPRVCRLELGLGLGDGFLNINTDCNGEV